MKKPTFTYSSTQKPPSHDFHVLAGSRSTSDTVDPEALPHGSCLLYVPLTVQGLPVRALLDSGALDNLPSHPLHKYLNIQLANLLSKLSQPHFHLYWATPFSATSPPPSTGKTKSCNLLTTVRTTPSKLNLSFSHCFTVANP